MSAPPAEPAGVPSERTLAPLDFAAARDFLERRFGHETHGYAILAFIPASGGPIRHEPIALDRDRDTRWKTAARHLRRYAENHDCYLAVPNYATAPTAKAKRTTAMIGHLDALYCERDAALLAPQLPLASLTVETSDGRYQDYWLLDQPTDVPTFEGYNRRIAVACGIGFEAVDATRLLRVPGTRNHKPSHRGEIVRLIACSDRRYTLADFDHLPEISAPVAAPLAAAVDDGERVPARRIVDQALTRAATDGRNASGLWLASQLRDNGYAEPEAEAIGLADYVPRVPATTPDGVIAPYTEHEYRASVRQAYKRPAREPWAAAAGKRTRRPARTPAASTAPVDAGGLHRNGAASEPPPPSGGTEEPATAEPAYEQRLNDVWNARRFAMQHGGDLRYCHKMKTWFVWDGRRWKEDSTGEVMRRAKRTAAALYSEIGAVAAAVSDKTREAMARWASRSHAKERLDAMIGLARDEGAIPIEPEDFDADPWLLACANGTIDLRTGTLREWRREDRITRLCPVAYEPDATFPLWDEFLDKATGGDAAYRAFLQRAAGYSLTGDTSEEVLFFVHGPAGTGKSTYLEAVKATIGEYATTADFEAFLARTHTGAPREDIAELAGARLVVSIEVDEGKKLAEGLVKMLTGGDTVRARFLYQRSFEFKPALKLWLAANHAPKVRDDDEAMWRRILRLRFTQVIPKAERKKEVKAALCNPKLAGPAILAWLVRGCLAWQEQGLGVPQSVDEATAQYRLEMDPLADFIADCCYIERDATATSRDLWKAYQEYARVNGDLSTLARAEFAGRLESRGCIAGKSGNVRLWKGIGLLTREHDPHIDETHTGEKWDTRDARDARIRNFSLDAPRDRKVSENDVPRVPRVPTEGPPPTGEPAPAERDLLWQWIVAVQSGQRNDASEEVRRAAVQAGFTFDAFVSVRKNADELEKHLNRTEPVTGDHAPERLDCAPASPARADRGENDSAPVPAVAEPPATTAAVMVERPGKMRRPFRYVPTAYVDAHAGQGVADDAQEGGAARVISFAAGAPLAVILDALPSYIERVLLCGARPGDGTAAGMYRWLADGAGAGWHRGRFYLDADFPVLRLTRREPERRIDVRRAAVWFGDGDHQPVAVRRALMTLLAALREKRTFSGARLLATPGMTGLDLWDRTHTPNQYPPLDTETQSLIAGTSGQGRIELCTLPGIETVPGFAYLDGRFMYAALTSELGVGPVERDERDEYAGFRPGRYRVRVTIPRNWDHLGLLPRTARSEWGDPIWAYPATPGESFETWADGAEVHLARDRGWEIRILERILLTQPAKGTPDPLEVWTRNLVAVRARVEANTARGGYPAVIGALVADAVRNLVLHTIGAFASQGRPETLIIPEGEPLPDDAIRRQFRRDLGVWFCDVRAPLSRWGAEHRHPEWSAAIWAKARRRLLAHRVDGVLTGALAVPREAVLALRTDALYLASDPGWPDPGRVGIFRLKGLIDEPVAAPHDWQSLNALRDRAAAGFAAKDGR
jgi:putative DNA primase/helicase